MAKLERIKIEARKEELEEQQKNAAEITQQVEAISTPQKKMEESDKLAKEALEKLRVAKKSVDILRKDFEQIISDTSVKNYLEKRGITTLEEYVSSDQGKDTDLAKRYQEVFGKEDTLRKDFRSKVKDRGEKKDELLGELEKNETEGELHGDKKEGIRTYSSLRDNANGQINEIPEKEIETLVDDLIEKKRVSLTEIVSKIVKSEYDNTKVISESDIVELQKYGKRYYYNAEKMFKNKITKLATEMTAASATIAYDDPSFNKNSVSSKDSYIRTRVGVILEKIDNDFRDSKGKVEGGQRGLDNIIATKEITEKLDAIKPEIEAIFSELDKNIKSNIFYSWIDKFYASGGNSYEHKMRIVFKEFDLKQNPLSKYFSSTESFVKGRETPVHSLKFDQLTKNITILEQDEESTKVELSQQQTRLRTFSNRNFFAKLTNKAEGENINTELRKTKEKIQNLAEIKRLLVALAEFINKIDTVMKNESISSLPFQNVDSSPEAYGASFIKVIDDYKKQLNQYI